MTRYKITITKTQFIRAPNKKKALELALEFDRRHPRLITEHYNITKTDPSLHAYNDLEYVQNLFLGNELDE